MVFDPLEDERVSPTVSVPRDDKDNPLVIPRGGAEAITYTRASGLVDCLAYDPPSLSNWRARYEAQGIAKRRDYAARIAAVQYSTGPLTGTLPIEARRAAAAEIDEVRKLAREWAGIDEAANIGTAGHSLTVPGSTGEATLEQLEAVQRGYAEVTAGLERVASEVFVVNDELRAAGTFDSAYLDPVNLPGFVIVGDTKTGKNYHQSHFEIQLAVYQGGELYLGADGGRLTFEEAFGLPVNADVAYLVHVSITGSPKPRIVLLDLERGRRLARIAAATRDARAELDKIGIGPKFDHRGTALVELDRLFGELLDGGLETDDFREQALVLHTRFKAYWTPGMTEQVKARLPDPEKVG